MAHRGAFAVEPSARRCSMSSTLMTTPSTSKPNEWRRCVKSSMRLPHLIDVGHDGGCVGHRELRAPRPLEELRVGGERPAFEVAEPVHPHGERSLADLARVLLAEGAGRGVPRVHERGLAALDPLLVHAVELGDRVVHLAADLDDVGRVVVGQPVGHVVEGQELLGDGLPHRAGAARGADREHAPPVHAVDGRAVDLQLARPADRRALGQAADDPIGPGPQVRLAEDVVERLHRLEVLERREGGVERRPHLLRGRVGRAELGEALLDRLELVEAGIELRIGHGEIGEHVVPVPSVPDETAQLIVLGPCRDEGAVGRHDADRTDGL